MDTGLPAELCSNGWQAVCAALARRMGEADSVLCVECYPGVSAEELAAHLRTWLPLDHVFLSESALLEEAELRERFDSGLTDDPVFGHLSHAVLSEFFDPAKLCHLRDAVREASGKVLIVGVGASLVAAQPSVLVYADCPRWELQLRQRAGRIGNLGLQNKADRPGAKYKRAFFLDWRVADRHKQSLFDRAGAWLDTASADPKLVDARTYREALAQAAHAPFRLVPFFDPGPWGGQWMRAVCDLPDGPVNYAWCFDCVPEENSLLLRFGDRLFETPAINLVFFQPHALLGEGVHARFGTEFPIRFDLLDTIGGGNLSLQVHPLTEYIQQHFSMAYTQDESYYLLDAEPGAEVWLGLRDDVDPEAMQRALRAAETGGPAFPAEVYVHRRPARKHDHFLIPAGTVHCSGAGCIVLEISATPFIFTFKMWDWQRLGMDGRPRPIHLQHAFANVQWDRRASWVERELAHPPVAVSAGEGWREERTGLHSREFIETRRHWFTGTVAHDTQGTVHVLNLVEGREALVESPAGAFAPFVVHYAETFIVPAAVGRYTIRPHGESLGSECATIRASVRGGAEALRWP